MKQKEEKEAQITVQGNKGVIKKKKGAGDRMGKTDKNKWLGYLELFPEPSLFCFNHISFIRNVFISLQKTANTLTRLQIQIYKYEVYSLKLLSIMDFLYSTETSPWMVWVDIRHCWLVNICYRIK